MTLLLAGAAAAGLPVVLHLLLKQEPKRLIFPAVRFLVLTQKTTRRKLRLRHLLLLALRVLLLALFCAALYQPTVPGFESGVPGVSFAAGRPVAAVLVIDTTPSMGYTVQKTTRLADAVRRAVEFVDALPAASRVAVATTSDPATGWELAPADARRRVEALAQPDGGGQPVSAVLRGVYPLFATADADGGSAGGEPLRKLVAVFTDRAGGSFAADQAADLRAAADAVPGGPAALIVFDVGADAPADVAVVAAEAAPVVSPAGTPVTITATVRATGPAVPAAVVRCTLSDGTAVPPQEVALPAGVSVPVTFPVTGLKPGVHQAEISLTTPDSLGPDGTPGFDNARYVTFRVGADRTLLTVTDDPAETQFWPLAHLAKREFGCDVVTPDKVPDPAPYSAVCVIAVRDPAPLWAKLKPYVERGGRVLVAPGGEERVGRDQYQPAASGGLLPAGLTGKVDLSTLPAPKPGDPDLRGGAPIDFDAAALAHPLFAPVKALDARTDFLVNPRRATRFWAVTPAVDGAVVARYAAPGRPPAVLEKTFPGGGKVVLLTTRLDDQAGDATDRWNDTWQTAGSSWYVYYPNRLATYLAGDAADVSYQFTTGQGVALPLPRGGVTGELVLEGPGVTGDDPPAVTATDLRLPPRRTLTAGNYRVRAGAFEEGFSLNPAAEETDLAKVPAAAFEAVGGPGCVVPAGRDFDLAGLVAQSGGTLPLFPALVVLVLVAYAAEGALANRFYRR